MSQELERVIDGEVMPDDVSGKWDVWEESSEMWRQGHSMTLMGQLIKARAASEVETAYGNKTMEEWADHVDAGRSTVYALARGYRILLEQYETHEAISVRLESSPLKITHVLKATRSDDVKGTIDKYEDTPTTTRQMDREIRQEGIPENVETVERCACPECGSVFELNRAATWTEAR